tara:strand:- start:14 stop:463 length:450 start_codon:yes stop_codon:yes gene_type:complete
MSKASKIFDKLSTIDTKLNTILKRLDALEKPRKSPVKPKTVTVNKKVGPVNITEFTNYILVTGDTFDIRDHFKQVGGKWDGDNKGWKIIKTRMSDYGEFKEDLETKCSKLNIKIGKLQKPGLEIGEKNATNISSMDNLGCMISSSDEEY